MTLNTLGVGIIESQDWGPSGEDTREYLGRYSPPRSLSRVYLPPQQGGCHGPLGQPAGRNVSTTLGWSPWHQVPNSATGLAWGSPMGTPYLGGRIQPRGGSLGVGPPMATPPLYLRVSFWVYFAGKFTNSLGIVLHVI